MNSASSNPTTKDTGKAESGPRPKGRSRFLFVFWDLHSSQLPARKIASELARRGHDIRWLILPREPIDLAELAVPERPLVVYGQIMASPIHIDQLRTELRTHPVDVLVVDHVLFGVLAAAELLRMPTACIVPTVPGALGGPNPGNPDAEQLLTWINHMRAALGLPTVRDVWHTWTVHTPIVVSLPQLDSAPAAEVGEFSWIGPILEPAEPANPTPDEPVRVLVSLSTVPAVRRLEQLKAQRILDALADLDCQVDVTLPTLDTRRLQVPANATLHDGYRSHAQLLNQAALTITHGGHGTVCASLAHAVPLLCVPNVIADHLFIADRVAQLGAGISLTPDADADQIRAAAQTILAEPAYRQAATRLQHSIAGTPGVTAAADQLEALTRTETPTDPWFPAATPRWPGDRP